VSRGEASGPEARLPPDEHALRKRVIEGLREALASDPTFAPQGELPILRPGTFSPRGQESNALLEVQQGPFPQ
jgi:hypothetical protein